MSCSKWAWTESCKNEECCGECDLCKHLPEDYDDKEDATEYGWLEHDEYLLRDF